MGPLMRRCVTRLPRSGVWGLLVAGAFLLLSTAAASVPMFAEATGNEALDTSIALVPSDAEAGAAPVIRIVGGDDPASNPELDRDLSRFPGTGRSSATASSIGIELQPPLTRYTSFVAVGPPIDTEADARLGVRNDRARIFGDADLAHALVPAPGFPAARPAPAGRPAVWVPAPVARTLRVVPGDEIQLGTQTVARTVSTSAVVAGIYAVGADGHIPADPPGTRRWTYRGSTLPRDSEFSSAGSYLLVSDIPTTNLLARKTQDTLLYTVEGGLDPARPTLAQARRTAAAIQLRQGEIRDPDVGGVEAVLHEQVVSGIPDLVQDAGQVADRTVAWTTTAGSAGTGLGLLAVLAVAAFGLVRRRVEIRHEVGLGLHPATVGALAAVEVLPVALVSTALGVLAARGLVGAVGPDGAITSSGIRSGAGHAGVAVAAGVLLIAAAAGFTAQRAARLHARSGPGRARPWAPAVVLVAVTATVGLLTRPQNDGPPGYLDLLVPLLILAAIGAAGGRLALAATAWRGRGTGGPAGLRGWSRRPALTLAARRVAAGGASAALLVMVMTIGLGFLIYSFSAASSVEQVSQDRAAVLAGARATVDTARTHVLDPRALRADRLQENEDRTPVPGVRTPPLPAGTTIVWRTRVQVPPEYGSIDLLVVDPERFARVAAWGSGPELARARADVVSLAAADREAVRQWQGRQHTFPIPAIGVGPVLPRAGDEASVITRNHPDRPIRMLDVVPAFPGYGGNLPMIVVPADSFFGSFGTTDPRIAPDPRASGFDSLSEFMASLWTSRTPDTLRAILQPAGLESKNLVTLDRIRQRPEIVAARQSTGYQLALGVCVAALAALGLAMFADRAATRARAADLMLTRLGLGARGIRRARALELAFLELVSLTLAVAGVLAVVPLGARLLDPGGSKAPPFALRPDPQAFLVALLAAVLTLVLALVVSRPRRGSRSAGEVLRDAA
jgi:MYXO-CTERM domain-containing protein